MTDACKYSPDIFFLSLFLFFGTFFLCSALKRFKFTPYFPAKVNLPFRVHKTFHILISSNGESIFRSVLW